MNDQRSGKERKGQTYNKLLTQQPDTIYDQDGEDEHEGTNLTDDNEPLSPRKNSNDSIEINNGALNGGYDGGVDGYDDDGDDIIEVSGFTWRDYYDVLLNYPAYRNYFFANFSQHIGNWFVQIANLLVVENLVTKAGADDDSGGKEMKEGSSLSTLIVSVMIPKAIFAQLGGILADRYDRRNLMIIMNAISAAVALFYIVAIAMRSLTLFFAVSGLRSAIESAQYPSTHGLVPLLVQEPRPLQLAVTIQSWAWCFTAVLGGMIAGVVSATVGYEACYILDSIAYCTSGAILYFGVKGNYDVTKTDHNEVTADSSLSPVTTDHDRGGDDHYENEIPTILPDDANPVASVAKNFKELFFYLCNCGFGLLVIMKTTATSFMAPIDIISATYTKITKDDGTADEAETSFAMGLTFAVLGLGSFLGPTMLNVITDAKKPATVQRSCVLGFLIAAIGWYTVGMASSFGYIFLAATFLRAIGTSTIWILSTLLLQTLTEDAIMGRVLAVDFTLNSLVDAAVAILYGKLYDGGLSEQGVSLLAALMGAVFAVFWGLFHAAGRGAAQARFRVLRRKGGHQATSAITKRMTSNGTNHELELIENSTIT